MLRRLLAPIRATTFSSSMTFVQKTLLQFHRLSPTKYVLIWGFLENYLPHPGEIRTVPKYSHSGLLPVLMRSSWPHWYSSLSDGKEIQLPKTSPSSELCSRYGWLAESTGWSYPRRAGSMDYLLNALGPLAWNHAEKPRRRDELYPRSRMW